ncbi:hypothetical protein J472_0743 [Acinetobacter baumannii 18689]|nr:hypothetical protein J472_0743 [Acinetobacter baumannii 18689]
MINALLRFLKELCHSRPNEGGKAEKGWSTGNKGNLHTRRCPSPASP